MEMNRSPRPRMQLTKPVQTSNSGLVTPRSTGSTPGPAPSAPELPSVPQQAMSYLDIARNAMAQLTDDEVQMLLEEFLDKQSAPSAADMFNNLKGGAPLVE